jgi:hypothetical protein
MMNGLSAQKDSPRRTPFPFASIGLWIALGVLALALLRHEALTTTLAGGFPESDDMMRLLQVRDWLAGQSWSDLRQSRLGPDQSFVMHWTRVIDAPIAGLLLLLSTVLEPESAENWTRVLFPAACLVLALAGGLRLGATLGLAAPLPLLFALLLLAAYSQFQPGRIDHHGPQIALLMFVYDSALRALNPATPKSASLTGALAALSIAVSVETAPLLAAACLVLVGRWVVVGAPAAPALRWLAFGLVGGFAAFYLAFAADGAKSAGACDAMSSAWLTAGLASGAALLALERAASRLTRPALRFGAFAMAGMLAVAVVGLLHPSCLQHPYAAIDPLVVEAWLSKVNEAQSLLTSVANDPGVRALLAPAILGGLGLLWALWLTQGLARARWFGLGAIMLAAWALTSFEVRALSQLLAIAAFGAVFAAQDLVARMQARWGLSGTWVFVALLPLFPLFWLAALDPAASAKSLHPAPACFTRAALSPLSEQAQSLTLAPIDAGAPILLRTAQRVLAAPYHRNAAGNKEAIEILLADPALAQTRIKLAGVRFVAICPVADDAKVLAAMAPTGLAARLLGDDAFDWLAPLHQPSAPLKIFEVR